MKRFNIIFLFLIGCYSLNAQDTDQKIPASLRGTKITAKWADRAVVKDGGANPGGKYMLWYQKPATVWEEALPLGNGQLGAMIFGGIADERIQLNESTLWDGYPLDPNDPSSLENLPEVRKLLFEGKNNEAVALAGKHMMGKPKGVKPFQSLGELWFDTPISEASGYVRSLNLGTAIAQTDFVSEGVKYSREAFISPIDHVLVIRLSSNQKGKISFNLTLKRQQDAVCEGVPNDPNSLVLKGTLPAKDDAGKPRGLSFAAQVKAISKGGTVKTGSGILSVNGADEVTLFVSGATNYAGLDQLPKGIDPNVNPSAKCAEFIQKASTKKYDQLKASHIKEHQRLFGRVEIQLGKTDASTLALPVDKRLEIAKEKGTPDNNLVGLYFQYGRYLLISS